MCFYRDRYVKIKYIFKKIILVWFVCFFISSEAKRTVVCILGILHVSLTALEKYVTDFPTNLNNAFLTQKTPNHRLQNFEKTSFSLSITNPKAPERTRFSPF